MAPQAQAAVFISEVAWMGTASGGANCEWLELYNDSDQDVSLVGWSISLQNPSSVSTITLSTSANQPAYNGIAARGFYFIGRTACSSYPVQTDWLGTFSISNDHSLITLKDASGAAVSTVDASAGWTGDGGLGGTNPSGGAVKKTPQWSGSAWFTADPTPRATNAAPEEPELEEPPVEEEETTPPTATIGGTAPLLPVVSPVKKLYLSSIPGRIVLTNAETPYSALVYDSTGKIRKDAEVRWAFGDGGSEEGEEVRYTYRAAGEYTAVVRATTRDGIEAVAMVQIVVQDALVSVEKVDERGITVRNAATHLSDLSLWKLSTGKRSFRLPEDTVIAPGRSALLPWEATKLPTSTEAALLFPDGRHVAPAG